ncbi:type III secretion system chaperone family protein [Actinoplanes sp. RD1]|uniref:YbjN domain-containing protein n=1 Tax=Actinoplanes sp. RD1 TaxID=3064538 RepID=UPI0027422696|nr:YbjN domain-containing protein [Actinoplanes sp. RD1]
MSAVPQPLSHDMIVDALKAREFAHFVDEDGDIGGNWQGCLIYFFRLGQKQEIFQVRVLTHAGFTVDDVPRLYAFCNAWNHDRLWPKAYVHTGDDGIVRVIGEVGADFEHGVTPAQLDQVMVCGIATGIELAEAVQELKRQ